MQVKWCLFLQGYTFTLIHQTCRENKVIGALSRRYHVLVASRSHVFVYDELKDLYPSGSNFGPMLEQCTSNHGAHEAKCLRDKLIQAARLVIEGSLVHLQFFVTLFLA